MFAEIPTMVKAVREVPIVDGPSYWYNIQSDPLLLSRGLTPQILLSIPGKIG